MSSRSQAFIGGDAHINNFGLYGTPQRDVIIDINFDEAEPQIIDSVTLDLQDRNILLQCIHPVK
jgi:uncharacterized protein (DUF2252 family)